MRMLLVAAAAAFTCPAFAADNDISGMYRLVGDQRKIVETGEIISAPAPAGFIVYGKEGRMQVIIVRQPRPKIAGTGEMTDAQRAELYRTMSAYGGTYKFDGRNVEHAVDISWNEIWNGTRQLRQVTREGDRLILTTPPYRSQIDGRESVNILTWERVK